VGRMGGISFGEKPHSFDLSREFVRVLRVRSGVLGSGRSLTVLTYRVNL
jgi:hypothetical protein